MNHIQKLGRSFLVPIALLPIAGFLITIGSTFSQESMDAASILSKLMRIVQSMGMTLWSFLPLCFAMGVTMGLAKKHKGVAVLSSVLGFMTMQVVITAIIKEFVDIRVLNDTPGLIVDVWGFKDTMQLGVIGGVCIGMGVAWLHNRYNTIKLPSMCSFFSGTRFIPLVSVLFGMGFGIIAVVIWPPVLRSLQQIGVLFSSLGYFGTFLYGFVYRALIPLGLHHAFYLPFWQSAVGGVAHVAGSYVEGSQNIIFAQLSAGLPISIEASRFFAGMFPVMIFGLPASALAMLHSAPKDKRPEIQTMLRSASIGSFFMGITEPLEFAMLHASKWVYYGIHCVLSGLSFVAMEAAQVGVGLTFSGGFLDFSLYGILPGNARTGWLNMIGIGILYALVYYLVFRICIPLFNLKTPGRYCVLEKESIMNPDDPDRVALRILKGLGGKTNITAIDFCATRLRVDVKTTQKVSEASLQGEGVSGVICVGDHHVQIIIGAGVQTIEQALSHYL